MGIKHDKKRKELWKIPQALLSTTSTWLLVTTNLGASPSSPNFTFHFHFHFSFHFLPKISGSPKAEEKLLICITPHHKNPSAISELSCSCAGIKTLLFGPCPSSAVQRAGCCPGPLWNWARDDPTPPQWSGVPQVSPSVAWGGENKSLRKDLLIYRAFKHFKGQKGSFSKSSNCPKMSPAPWPCWGLMLSQLTQGTGRC